MAKERYRLQQREDGLWNVLDELIGGGPVEIAGVLLYGLERDDAEELFDALRFQDVRLLEKLDAIAKRRP